MLKGIGEVFSRTKKYYKERHLIENIEEAFLNNEFKMHFQFVVDNKTKKIASAEALSRWENSCGEIIFPGAYIGLMEKSRLIIKFDYYMFELACKKLSEWKGTEFDNLKISCNITKITISEKNFAERIKQISDKFDFDKSKLMIEITEDAIEKNLEVARENIIRVKKLGFSIALDDIGNGYASLINICDYPIDVVKLDRKFALYINQENGRKLFLGITSLIHSLGFEIVSEGVETEEQNEFVSSTECDYIQGWYYTKALSEKDAEEFYKEYMKKF